MFIDQFQCWVWGVREEGEGGREREGGRGRRKHVCSFVSKAYSSYVHV